MQTPQDWKRAVIAQNAVVQVKGLVVVMAMPPRTNDNDGIDENTGKDDDDGNADDDRSSSNYYSKDNDGCNIAMAAVATIHHRRKRSVSDDNDLSSIAEVIQQPQRPCSSCSSCSRSSCVGALLIS
jgi:hypothetical protein